MSKIVVLFGLLASLQALASEPAPLAVQTMAGQFHQTMMVCPEKIWPDFTWKDLKIAFVYPSKKESWVWDASANSIQKTDISLLPTSVLESSYEFFKSGSQDSMSLNMEERDDEVFELGVHEFFHNQEQKKWISKSTSGGRGTEYPVSWQPRYYRRMLFDSLKKYFSSGNQADLSQARGWYDKWVREYPAEANSTTDGYEGTAQYAGIMATLIRDSSCSAAEGALRADAIKEVNANFGRFLSGTYFGLDSEGYEVGGLAAFILRFDRKDLRSWTNKVLKGETPVEILMENVRASEVKDDANLVSIFSNSAIRINGEKSGDLDPAIRAWKDKSFVRVAVPMTHLQSNLRPKYFAKSTELGLNLYPLYVDHVFLSPNGSVKLTMKANSVFFSHMSSACRSNSTFTLVHQNDVRLINGKAWVRSQNAEGSFPSKISAGEQGFQYLCIEN